MRAIPRPRPAIPGPRPDEERLSSSLNGLAPLRFIRGAVRNSPWIVIAVSAHVVGIALLSVLRITTHTQAADAAPSGVVITHAPVEEEQIEAESPIVDTGAVKVREAEKPGQINPDEVFIADAPPGVKGDKWDSSDYEHEAGARNDDPDALPDTLSGSPASTSVGVGVVGHHGTSPSPWVSLRAGKNGRGQGGHGDGFDKGGPGGAPAKDPQIAVWAALRWLKNHQSGDGRWDSDGFDACCKTNRCDGAGESTHDVGATGLALLCFLGTGQTHQSGEFQPVVKNGLRYLRDSQDAEGCFGPRIGQHFLYDHACASLAMTEAYGMTGTRALREPAQRGVGFILKSRNPYLAWRYAAPADGENDTSVTGWMVMALKSAKLADLEIETSAIKDAIAWVEKMTEPEFGRTGYQQRGGPPARTNEAAARFPNSKSESTTAVGLTVRIFGGRDTKTDEMIGKGADLLAKCLPKWDVDGGSNDFYYWYYGSLAMFQVGGPRWVKWNEAMKTAIIDHQRLEKDRCEYGSWDPVDCWSAEGGRVYSTALNCLTMEVYYRYPLLGVRAGK